MTKWQTDKEKQDEENNIVIHSEFSGENTHHLNEGACVYFKIGVYRAINCKIRHWQGDNEIPRKPNTDNDIC